MLKLKRFLSIFSFSLRINYIGAVRKSNYLEVKYLQNLYDENIVLYPWFYWDLIDVHRTYSKGYSESYLLQGMSY